MMQGLWLFNSAGVDAGVDAGVGINLPASYKED